MPIVWIFISYILGSIPFGYLISRFSGKNVLQIGWRKTSGSNVFKNVGKWQGVATGLLDLAKGYLAVWLATAFGFSSEIQVLSGVTAVAGHNWSLFLGFAGGRGIGTFIGAFLALAPQVLLVSIVLPLILALIWDAAIATLLLLALAIVVSFYHNQFDVAGVFTVLCLVPIFLKRLSPMKEIKTAGDKKGLILSRLFFDDDKPDWDFRIRRIVKRQKENPSRAIRIVKPLASPLLVSSRLGWKAAKFGVNMAKKPLEKWVLGNNEKVVTELTTEDFKKMMIAAAKKIVIHQEEINRINVFPVADKDTGYNLAATLLGVEGVVSSKDYPSFRELTQDIKEAAMINARGNAGMIYTGYIIEVLDRIKHLKTIDAFHLALAMKRGIKSARSSVAEPVEGTILDVIKTAGTKTFEYAKTKKEKNIIKILAEAYKGSLISLKETKEKLQVLKENDVVDAGALGFVKILEAWLESLKGVSSASKTETAPPILQPEVGEKIKYRYEAVVSFRKNPETSIDSLKDELSLLGDSLEMLELEGKVKIHIHTNEPDAVLDRLRGFPEFESRTEDMEAQVRAMKKKPLGLVVDEIADLPAGFLQKHDIIVVPFATRFPDGEAVISKENIYRKMKEAVKEGRPLPTTSAPSFREFLLAYQKAFERFEKILAITVSSKLSGAYSSARIARSFFKKPEKLNIYVFDCNTAEAGEGLAVVKAQELISQGMDMEETVNELKEFCPQITLLACIDDFKYVVRGGRVRLPKILIKPVHLIQKMGIKFIVGLRNGKVGVYKISLGKNVPRLLADEIKKQARGKKIKLAIAHADNIKNAQELKEKMERNGNVEVVSVSPVSPVVATHVGPGTLLAAFHPIDN
jgi:hypothetical protein